jgi:hypothetical protein
MGSRAYSPGLTSRSSGDSQALDGGAGPIHGPAADPRPGSRSTATITVRAPPDNRSRAPTVTWTASSWTWIGLVTVTPVATNRRCTSSSKSIGAETPAALDSRRSRCRCAGAHSSVPSIIALSLQREGPRIDPRCDREPPVVERLERHVDAEFRRFYWVSHRLDETGLPDFRIPGARRVSEVAAAMPDCHAPPIQFNRKGPSSGSRARKACRTIWAGRISRTRV